MKVSEHTIRVYRRHIEAGRWLSELQTDRLRVYVFSKLGAHMGNFVNRYCDLQHQEGIPWYIAFQKTWLKLLQEEA